jgi:hypothetical protein
METTQFNCVDKTKDCVAKDAHLIVYPTPLLLLQNNDSTKQQLECHVSNLTNAPEKDNPICCVSVYAYEPPRPQKSPTPDLAASPSLPYPKKN